MANYLVWREGDRLRFVLHNQHREDDLLLQDFVPGGNLVMIPDATEEQVEEHADLYFNGEYAEPQTINAWVAKALQRQAHLKSL